MKALFIVVVILSLSTYSTFSLAAPCLDTHVRLVTKSGRIMDRKGITVNLRVKGVARPIGSEDTDSNGNACVNYTGVNFTGGEEFEIFIGVVGDDKDEKLQPWSTWSVISPYKGLTHFPKPGKQRLPIEVIIVPRYLEERLIGYAEKEKDEDPSKIFDCPYDQGREFVQVITVGEKEKSEDIISSFRSQYFGCREGFLRDGKKLYRVLVEAKKNTNPDNMCRDIRKNHLKTSQFKCVSHKLDKG